MERTRKIIKVMGLSLLLSVASGCSEGVPEFLKLSEPSDEKTLPTPERVTDLDDGTISEIASESPKFNWSRPNNLSEDNLSHYEIKVYASDNSVVFDWMSVGKATQFQFLSLPDHLHFVDGSNYKLAVRAVNKKGIQGLAAIGDGWSVNTRATSQVPPQIFSDPGGSTCISSTTCSLRAAISASLANGPDQVVQLDSGTYRLSLGSIPINDSITIKGRGPDSTIIDANTLQAFNLTGDASKRVVFEDLKIINGFSSAAGGAINVSPGHEINLTVRNVHFENNRQNNFGGSAIHVHSDDTLIEDCLFKNNISESPATYGGAVAKHDDGTLTIKRSQFFANRNQPSATTSTGGAISTQGGTITVNIDDSYFGFNYSDEAGGAISIVDDATLNLKNNLFLKNKSGGSGGAIYLSGTGTATMINNTFVYNRAEAEGGAIYSKFNFSMTNSLFSANVDTLEANLNSCHRWGGTTVTSLGGNIFDDSSCFNTGIASDTIGSSSILHNNAATPFNKTQAYLNVYAGSASLGHGVNCSGKDALGKDRPTSCDAGATQALAGPRPEVFHYFKTKAFFARGVTTPKITPFVSGGTPTHFSVSPPLPAGLTLDPLTGELGGSPEYPLSQATQFTLTASNDFGQSSTSVDVTIKESYIVNSRLDTPDQIVADGICSDSNGKCTLRAAIEEINAAGDKKMIYLPAGIYYLSSNLPALTEDLFLVGEGAQNTVITGQNSFSLLTLNGPNKDYALSELELREANGGALIIENDSTVVITNTRFIQNSGTSGAGIVFTSATTNSVEIQVSHFEDNVSESSGGAIRGFGSDQDLTISASSFINNSCTNGGCDGGAIYGGQISFLGHSLLSGNSANDRGGAIFSTSIQDERYDSVTFHYNSSAHGGAIAKTGGSNLRIGHTTFYENSGSVDGAALELSAGTGNIYYHNSLFENNMSGSSNNPCGDLASGSIISLKGNTKDVDDPECPAATGDAFDLDGTFINFSNGLVGTGHFQLPKHLPLSPAGAAINSANSLYCNQMDSSFKIRLNGEATFGLECDSGAIEYHP